MLIEFPNQDTGLDLKDSLDRIFNLLLLTCSNYYFLGLVFCPGCKILSVLLMWETGALHAMQQAF